MQRFISRLYSPSPELNTISAFEVAPDQGLGRRLYKGKMPTKHAEYLCSHMRLWAENTFGQVNGPVELVVSKALLTPGYGESTLAFNNTHFERSFNYGGATHACLTIVDWQGDEGLPLGTNVWEGIVSFENEQHLDVSNALFKQGQKGLALCMDSRTVHAAPYIEATTVAQPTPRVMVSGIVELGYPAA